jgi:hypothetical protein
MKNVDKKSWRKFVKANKDSYDSDGVVFECPYCSLGESYIVDLPNDLITLGFMRFTPCKHIIKYDNIGKPILAVLDEFFSKLPKYNYINFINNYCNKFKIKT